MRTDVRENRELSLQAVLDVIQQFGPFLTKSRIMAQSKVDGMALKRCLATLVNAGELVVMRTTEFQGGEYTAGDETIIYAQAGAAIEHRLKFKVLSDNSLLLDESSSDRALTMADGAESRYATQATIRSQAVGSLRDLSAKLTACLHPTWRGRPAFLHSDIFIPAGSAAQR